MPIKSSLYALILFLMSLIYLKAYAQTHALTEVDQIANLRKKWINTMDTEALSRLKNSIARMDTIIHDLDSNTKLLARLCENHRCDSGLVNNSDNDITSLSILSGLSQDAGAGSLTLSRFFSGSAMRCREYIAESVNCCADSGWFNKTFQNRCDSQEKLLSIAKDQHRVIFVGERCKKRFIHSCIENENLYCVFESELAMRVQLQGRYKKLHIHFGSAKNGMSGLNCRGLTDSELELIDLSSIDLSGLQFIPHGTPQQLSEDHIQKSLSDLEQQERYTKMPNRSHHIQSYINKQTSGDTR